MNPYILFRYYKKLYKNIHLYCEFWRDDNLDWTSGVTIYANQIMLYKKDAAYILDYKWSWHWRLIFLNIKIIDIEIYKTIEDGDYKNAPLVS